ncbi:MAG TPA: LysR substrate-binding domain-containing protein [Acidobacteriaceae bacterium]
MARNETKLMESVIALFEELNFTHAAEKLHCSQSTVTKNIKVVERRADAQFFLRDHKNVRATNACRAYVGPARVSLLYGERAFQAARTAVDEEDIVQHVGRSPYIDPFLTSLLLSIRPQRFPHLRIELSSQYSYDLVHDILAGALDLVIATEPPASPLLTAVKVAESPFYIGMSKRDKLARNPSVTLDAMAGRCWILFERRLHPLLHDAVMQLAEDRKIIPAKIQHVTSPEEAFPFVDRGGCLAFLVKAGASLMARSGVALRPLAEDALSLKTYMVSLADNRSKVTSALVRSFVKKLEEVTKTVESLSLIA